MALVPSFEQQGAVNWDSILKQSVTFSISLLGRLSSYGVDPYSLVIAQHVARDFVLSSEGQRNVLKSLESLPLYRGYGNALWFGFGIDSFARILSKTDEGCSLLALCAALCETFGEEYAADTMHALVKLKNVPSNLTPSVAQWIMIVKACAGMLSTSKFPLLVDGFLRLISRDPATYLSSVLGPPRPQELAKVLDGLGGLTTGNLQAITIDGDAPLAWIGAVAEWLFDLRVSLEDAEGNLVQARHGEAQGSQCRLRLPRSTREEVLNVSSTTYQLYSIKQVFGPDEPEGYPTMQRRMSWDSCLAAVYGDDFFKLMELPKVVGQTLGCVTRLLDMSLGQRPEPTVLMADPDLGLVRSGSEFINFILRQFPELQPAQDSMLLWHPRTSPEARVGLDEAMRIWRQVCGDTKCQCYSRGRREGTMQCSVSILVSIVRIGLALFQTNYPDDLLPTRDGWRHAAAEERGVSDELDFLKRVSRLELGGSYGIALHLFSGVHRGTYTGSKGIAKCAAGLCVYRHILSGIRLDPDHMHRVCIVPGQIMFNERPYPEIFDASNTDIDLPRSEDYGFPGKDFSDMTELSLMLSESSRGLGVYFTLHNPALSAKRQARPFVLLPGRFLRIAGESASKVWCPGFKPACQNSLLETTELISHEEPWIRLRLTDMDISIIIEAHEYHRAAVLSASDGYNTLFVHAGQCIYCCLKFIGRTLFRYGPVFVVVQGQTESSWFWTPWNLEHKSRHDATDVHRVSD